MPTCGWREAEKGWVDMGSEWSGGSAGASQSASVSAAGATSTSGQPSAPDVLREALLQGSPRWRVAEQLPHAALSAIPGVTALQAQLLHNRGVVGKDAALAFLAADWRVTRELPGQAAAIARVRAALASGERIIVYGDHDCDGMTSCAAMLMAFRALGANAGAHIPLREDDGRGLNAEAVRQLAAAGTRLIVTTDCGSANVTEVALARQLGMDVIITDHHPILGETPRDCVLVNPRLGPERGPHDDLAGVGVAFRLAHALLRELAPERAEDEAARLLDLVAIGTVGDIVPMTSENWALVRAGLERLRRAPRPGLRALLARAEVGLVALTERDITYVIAPRINAAARLGQPIVALDLLLARTEAEGDALAGHLDALNQERQRITEEIMVEAERQAHDQIAGEREAGPLVSAEGAGWPLGMLGLVASRLAERNQRAAVVISHDGEEARGSARGPDGVNLGAALAERAEVFRRFGGHARAAGFTLASADVAALLDYLRERLAAQRLAAPDEAAPTVVDCRLPLNRLIPRIYREQQALAPFGPGFAEPIYLCQGARVTSCWRSGAEGRNLRLRARDATGEAVFFWARQGGLCDLFRARMSQNSPLDIVFSLDAFARANGELDLLPRIISARPLE